MLFAHLGFHEDFDEKALTEEFHDVTGADLNDFLELDALDSLFQNGQPNLDTDNPSKYLLYQDPLLGIFDRHIEDLDLDTERYYQDLADRLEICRLMIRCLLSITVSPARSPARPTLASA